jgi:hypothetical protein
MPFSTMQRVCVVEHYFRTQSKETVKQAHQVHFLDAAASNKSTIFRLINQRRHSSHGFYEHVETG